MYCVFNATTTYDADTGNPLGWPLETNYGYFCDQRDKNLYILSSGLINMLTIVGMYLIAVLLVGPRLMQNRKPFEIKNLIRLYNFAMILFNCYMIKRAMRLVDNGRSFFNCRGVEINLSHVDEIAYLTELFLYSRLADFLDTVWFVLRKKQSHVSFLHVFHHSYVPITAYLFTRWVPVVPNTMSFPFINSAVHVVMYTYYLLATFPSLRQHLWWKRYLTALQMLQFVAVLIYNIFGYYYFGAACGKPQLVALCGSLISALIFLALFYSFYKRTYVQQQQQQQRTHQHHQKQQQLQTNQKFAQHFQEEEEDADQRRRRRQRMESQNNCTEAQLDDAFAPPANGAARVRNLGSLVPKALQKATTIVQNSNSQLHSKKTE